MNKYPLFKLFIKNLIIIITLIPSLECGLLLMIKKFKKYTFLTHFWLIH